MVNGESKMKKKHTARNSTWHIYRISDAALVVRPGIEHMATRSGHHIIHRAETRTLVQIYKSNAHHPLMGAM